MAVLVLIARARHALQRPDGSDGRLEDLLCTVWYTVGAGAGPAKEIAPHQRPLSLVDLCRTHLDNILSIFANLTNITISLHTHAYILHQATVQCSPQVGTRPGLDNDLTPDLSCHLHALHQAPADHRFTSLYATGRSPPRLTDRLYHPS